MATSIEAQGLSVDEAIQIALNQLGVSRDKVEIEILHHPRRGILGIGARRAKVRATLRESVMLDGEEFDMSDGTSLDDKPRRRRRRGGRNRDGRPEGSEALPAATAAPRAPVAQGRDGGRVEGGERRGDGRRGEGEAGRGRGEGGRGRDDRRGGRGRGEGRGERVAGGGEAQARGNDSQTGGGGGEMQARGGQEPRENGPRPDGRDQRGGRDHGQQDRSQEPRDRGGRQREQGERRDRGRGRGPREEGVAESVATDGSGTARRSESAAAPASTGAEPEPRVLQTIIPRRPVASEEPPLDAEALEAIRVRAEELVRDLLSKMGFPAEVSSSVDEVASEAVVAVRAENEGLLIGRRGQTLDSLEHIINRMVLRGDTGGDGRVLLDIGDYRRRRRESLEELATRLRTRAVGERRTVQVSPMSPRDRKFFAQAFAEDESVEVRALGAGFYRRVIVAPAGMGAAAVEAAEAAGASDDDGSEGNFPDAEG